MKIDERLNDIVALVEATRTEQFFLWREFNRLVLWEEDSQSFVTNLRHTFMDDRPINLCFGFAKINGKRIAFWECVSQIADYRIIEKWIEANLPSVLQSNAMNFHNVIHEVYPYGFPIAPLVPDDFFELIKRAEKAGQGDISESLNEISRYLRSNN